MNKAILEGLSPSTNNFAQSKKNNTTSWPTPDCGAPQLRQPWEFAKQRNPDYQEPRARD